MNFTFSGIFSVLSQALPPFLPLILTLLAVLVLVQLIARRRSYRLSGHRCLPAGIVALLIGASALWWLPALTSSRLAFVATTVDWVALVAATLGIALFAWLVLHPLSYLVRGPRQG
ncbi:MAG TPA: DUF5368 family protein [Halomonas sp.]|nr:DUF5368 family protein [Halomonas sp.]